jgi:hypothetical protein
MRNLLLLLFFIPALVWAQNQKASLKLANDYFNAGNYESALQMYLSLQNDNPNDQKVNYKIGVCYLNSNVNKSRAIPFLEKVMANDKDEPNASFLLGRAFHFANKFDDAIKYYSLFKSNNKGNPNNIKDVDLELQACYNAKELIKYPVNVEFENLGKMINSSFSDDFPFVPKDESFILFNSRREGNSQGIDGKFFSDVYISYVKEGKWSMAKPLKEINTPEGDEEIIGLSSDGSTALFMFDNNLGSGDLFISKRTGDKFEKPQRLPDVINSKFNEIAASLSADGSQIYFASDRTGGFGGIDIYVSKILPNGNWGEAKNLGPFVNTKFDEDFPSISNDGTTLLFSSKGHTTMGGYDIFKATYDEDKQAWGNVKNIGFPINSAGDDLNLCLSKDNKYGYMSSIKVEGSGDNDIYRIAFKDEEPEYTVIKGKISCMDDLRTVNSANITVNRVTDMELMGTYLPNPQNMRYVIILPPGKYEFIIEGEGFKTYTEKIEVLDKSSFKPYVEKDVKLIPN